MNGARLAVVATLAALLAALLALGWPRPRFDMAATLAAIADRQGVWDNQWDRPGEKIASLLSELRPERDPVRRFELRREVAWLHLFDGAPERAIAALEELEHEAGRTVPASYRETVKADLAFAYFRLGEVENCTANKNADSCLFPIRDHGVHVERRGATQAARLYAELLSDPKTDPENALSYRWLLNLSYMTLGRYPDGVPKRWLIAPETFRSDHDIGRFREVAVDRGVAEFGLAGGVVLEDFDNDGHLDLMLSHMGIRDQQEYFHNNGDGTFTRMTPQAGLTGIVGGLNLIQADYDNDGCVDVLVLRGAWLHDKGQFPNSLLRNDCAGRFTDVTAQAGLLSYYPTQTATWADLNNDGWLDLFVGNEIVREHVKWPDTAKSFELYVNEGNGTFTEVGAASGIGLRGMIKAVVSGDYDNDGWQDLYVSVLGGPNHLFRNLGVHSGAPRFADVTRQAGVAEPIMSFTCWFWDYDHDGWLDIFVSGYSATLPNIVREYLGQKGQARGERPRLYRNNEDGTFTDVSREAGLDRLLLTMGANFGDLDNDGYLDFYLGTGAPPLTTLVPNRMFRNHEGRYFQDVTTSGGFGHLQKGHGVAFGDIDNSGNQDVFEGMGGAYASDKSWSALYKNPGHGNHWIKLRLVGVEANRFAVGARLRIVSVTPDGARRETFGVVSSGGSFGASSLRPHIGLGKAPSVDLLEITWPGSGRVQRITGPIPADRVYEIREGEPGARARP